VKKLPSAFVFINTEPASIPEVLKKLRATEGVEGAEMVCGVYDIVAKVKTETMDKLKHIVAYKIRALANVKSTQTLLVVRQE
jgi:DNA-binding Lrp family transcriptional regulator